MIHDIGGEERDTHYKSAQPQRRSQATLRWPFWLKLGATLVVSYVIACATIEVLVTSCFWPTPAEACLGDPFPPPAYLTEPPAPFAPEGDPA